METKAEFRKLDWVELQVSRPSDPSHLRSAMRHLTELIKNNRYLCLATHGPYLIVTNGLGRFKHVQTQGRCVYLKEIMFNLKKERDANGLSYVKRVETTYTLV